MKRLCVIPTHQATKKPHTEGAALLADSASSLCNVHGPLSRLRHCSAKGKAKLLQASRTTKPRSGLASYRALLTQM